MTPAIHIDRLLQKALQSQASEIRCRVGQPPRMYVDSSLVRMRPLELTTDEIQSLVTAITPEAQQQILLAGQPVRFVFGFGKFANFQVLINHTSEGLDLRIRPMGLVH